MSNEIVRKTLNPFDVDTSTLEENVIHLLGVMAREDGIEALQSNRSFRPEMIEDMDPSQTAGEALTSLLGKGFWTEWNWSAAEAMAALKGLTERKRLLKWAMDEYDSREKQTHGYVRGLH